MFDPRSPYQRRRWHYDSDQPLSVAQLIAAGSLDARSAALLWLAIQRHQSVIVSGPTDPTPGVGKTTTLNALLEFLPAGTTLVYTMGMYEDFDFTADTEPGSTCVLANEVSDHLPIYMWGRVARKLLRLPAQGFAVATSCHADTLEDVLHMLQGDLRLDADAIGKLGIVMNIGLVGRLWPPRRRVLTVNYLRCRPRDVTSANEGDSTAMSDVAPSRMARRSEVDAFQLAAWNPTSDRLVPAAPEELAVLAQSLGMPLADFTEAVDRRTAVLETLAAGRGASISVTRHAIEELMLAESDDAPAPSSDEAAPNQG
jgi:Type II/IV secretion system protein